MLLLTALLAAHARASGATSAASTHLFKQAVAPPSATTRIHIGSCSDTHEPQPLWNVLEKRNADAFFSHSWGSRLPAHYDGPLIHRAKHFAMAVHQRVLQGRVWRYKYPNEHYLGLNAGEVDVTAETLTARVLDHRGRVRLVIPILTFARGPAGRAGVGEDGRRECKCQSKPLCAGQAGVGAGGSASTRVPQGETSRRLREASAGT